MVKTRNVKFCAYLRHKGYEITQVDKISRGKAEYTIKISDEEFDLHKIHFNQSELLEYSNKIDSVKELAY